MSRTADLYRHQLPSGQTCRQITLKGEYFCRHHRRLFHKSENEMIHEEAMERLAAELQSLDLPDLLHALYGKLTRLRSTVRANPEAQLALTITLERMKQHGHNQRPAHLRSGHSQPAPAPMNFPENSMESMNQQMLEFLKVLQNQ